MISVVSSHPKGVKRPNLPEITAVTFDLWQTLILDNRQLGQARAQLRLKGAQDALARAGESYDLEHIQEAYRACYRHCHSIRETLLDLSFQEQVEVFINNISPGLVARLDQATTQEIVRTYADSFTVYPPEPHSQAVQVLRDLKAMGLGLGLISNTGMTPGATFRTFLQQHGMLKYFEVLTFSDEVRLAKPSREIFLLTLRSMGVTPAQTVHVGDHVLNDIVGAKSSGLKTILIAADSIGDDPAKPDSRPDATVTDLALVVPAIARLTGTSPQV